MGLNFLGKDLSWASAIPRIPLPEYSKSSGTTCPQGPTILVDSSVTRGCRDPTCSRCKTSACACQWNSPRWLASTDGNGCGCHRIDLVTRWTIGIDFVPGQPPNERDKRSAHGYRRRSHRHFEADPPPGFRLMGDWSCNGNTCSAFPPSS